jgi:hypothetical protein
MKYSTIQIATAILFFFSSYNVCTAQTATHRARLGVKGGVNFSNLNMKNADTKMRTGVNLGLFAKLPVSGMFSVQPELYYITKGSDVTYNNAFVDGTARFNLNYLEVPLLLVANITDYFNFHAGPYVSYLINGTVKNKANINLFDFEKNINTDDYDRFDAGIAVGAGIDIKAISLGARYNFGLTKVGKERTFLGTSYTFPDARNGVFNFYISLSLN